MLDFHKLILQIEEVGRDSLVDRGPQHEVIARARAALEQAATDSASLSSRLERNKPWVLWPIAMPLEPFGTSLPVELRSEPVTVVAVDGSQIMPSRHEVHSCYLLNMGIVVISYGAAAQAAQLAPQLVSEPMLYHRPEDLYPLVDRRRVHIDELYVSLERNLRELETVSFRGLEANRRGLPVVAMLDGSLIPWSLEKMPADYQETYLERVSTALDALRQVKIPLIGYLSHSRSSDLVNDLRVSICPYPVSHCRELCGQLNEEDFPCSQIWPLSDRQLIAQLLPEGYRTAIFLSGASVASSLAAAQRTCFLYLNVGCEVARLEFPRWLADDLEALSLALATVRSQVGKGMGYPVSLSEAHNLAVIRGQDRARFFELLTRHLITLGADRVTVSPKESRKRRGIV